MYCILLATLLVLFGAPSDRRPEHCSPLDSSYAPEFTAQWIAEICGDNSGQAPECTIGMEAFRSVIVKVEFLGRY